MARSRQRTSQVTWHSGEVSPEMEGRTDQQRYYQSASLLENWKLRPLGGVTRRPGTTFVARAKTGALRVQMVPFIARQSVAYALEFGEAAGAGYIRFFRNNGQIQSTPDLVTNGGFTTALTGWTPTGAAVWLGDTANLPVAPELISNGTFTTNMVGWNVSGVTASGGVANMSAAAFMNRTITVANGSSYTFAFRIVSGTVTVSLSNTNFVTAAYAPGTYSVTVTTTSTSTLVQFDARPAPAGTAQVDDVSLQLQSSVSQSITVVAGTAYTLSFRVVDALPSVAVTVGSTVGGSDILVASSATGTYTYPVVSTTTTMAIRFGGSGQIDDVKLQLPTGAHEIVSPYLAGDLPKVRWAPSADVLYLACEGYAPRKLTRTSDTGWTLAIVNFRPPATEEKPTVFAGVTLTLGAVTGTSITATASTATWLTGDVDRQIKAGAGRAVIKTFVSTTQVTVDILDDFASTVIGAGGWTLNGSPNATLTPSKKEPKGAVVTLTATTLNVFRSTDVGKYVRIQNGLIRITAFTSALVVTGEILHKLDAATGTTNWTLEVPSWDTTDGWPIDVGFSSGDRLVWGRGDRIWASVVGDYENMSPSTLDDDAFTLALRTSEVSEIAGIIGATELQVFTSGAEFIITGGTDAPITPTNFKITSDTTYGAARRRVIRVNGQTLFVDRSSRGLREQVFDYAVNRYVAVDLLQLSQHLFPIGQTIGDLAYQRSPESIVYAGRSDGVLCGLTYLRAEQVIGWWRFVTHGAVESFCVIPHPDGDREQVWLAVQRTIGGVVMRYIERIDDTSVFTDAAGVTYGQKNTDCTLSYTGVPLTVVAGLSHLEGESVWAVGGGAFLGTFTVASGQITLPAAYSTIEVGLAYTSTLITMQPEVQVAGTSQGNKKRNAQILARVYRTAALKGNGHTLLTKKGDEMGRALDGTGTSLYTGDATTANLGWDTEGKITLTADQPLPVTVILLSGLLGVGV